jgi:hypothetical protein
MMKDGRVPMRRPVTGPDAPLYCILGGDDHQLLHLLSPIGSRQIDLQESSYNAAGWHEGGVSSHWLHTYTKAQKE